MTAPMNLVYPGLYVGSLLAASDLKVHPFTQQKLKE
jgi:hypothetical protein